MKGISGNPAGKPKGAKSTLKTLFKKDREAIRAGLLHLARNATSESVRLAAWIEIANRSDGKPTESREPIAPSSSRVSPLSPEERRALAAALVAPENETQ